MNSKKVKINQGLLIIYTLVILYFMFKAFDRANLYDINTYSYALTIHEIPLWIPNRINYDWIFSMGNLLAFIPFGVFIPGALGKKVNFISCLIIFMGSIFILEVTQMLTKLGSFDMGDILVNTLGFVIGYVSVKYCQNKNNFQMTRFVCHCILLINITLISSQCINTIIFKETIPQINMISTIN